MFKKTTAIKPTAYALNCPNSSKLHNLAT